MTNQDQQQVLVGRLEIGTKPSCYLASLALDKEIDPLVLVTQFAVQFILERIESFRLVTGPWYSFCVTLSLGCVELY